MADENDLDEVNGALNPAPPALGMPWYGVIGVLVVALVLFFVPGCRIAGILLSPVAFTLSWWLTKDDPKELLLILHELLLPSDFDPGK